MGFPSNSLSLLPHFLLFFFFFFNNPSTIPMVESALDSTTLVYKGCAKQAFSDPTGVYSQTISSLFSTLISQSSKAKFFKTTAAAPGGGGTTISGLFQCRGDLSSGECYRCVSKLPILIEKLCGLAVAARIQVVGCYMLYEVTGFAQISGLEMLYKTCRAKNVGDGGFTERRDTALSALENGIGSGNNGGFYTSSYGSVYVLGQCEGDLGISDCGECVKSAVQRSQVECGNSISAQIYLNRCFISYSFYPNGVPTRSSSSPSNSLSSPSGSGQSAGKTVAIILGGSVAVGFLVICLMIARGLFKKHDDF